MALLLAAGNENFYILEIINSTFLLNSNIQVPDFDKFINLSNTALIESRKKASFIEKPIKTNAANPR